MGFMLTNGIIWLPMTAFLIETFTTRQLFLYAMGVYCRINLGVNALVSGLVMMPSGIAMGILQPGAGKMYDRIGGRPHGTWHMAEHTNPTMAINVEAARQAGTLDALIKKASNR